MENQENIKISIPNPCHEKWDTMTPNEKGAFCGKCCKTVVDFTQKTAIEITAIIKNATNKSICGRFLSKQLAEPQQHLISASSNVVKTPNISFKIQSFAIAVFIAFGTTLFSCSTTRTTGEVVICRDTAVANGVEDEIEHPLMGKIAPVPVTEPTPSNSDENSIKEYKIGKMKRE